MSNKAEVSSRINLCHSPLMRDAGGELLLGPWNTPVTSSSTASSHTYREYQIAAADEQQQSTNHAFSEEPPAVTRFLTHLKCIEIAAAGEQQQSYQTHIKSSHQQLNRLLTHLGQYVKNKQKQQENNRLPAVAAVTAIELKRWAAHRHVATSLVRAPETHSSKDALSTPARQIHQHDTAEKAGITQTCCIFTCVGPSSSCSPSQRLASLTVGPYAA
jgi:hypothetical protein